MEFGESYSVPAACISGIAAIYWLGFSCVWAVIYFKARKEYSRFSPLYAEKYTSYVPFHLGALLYLFFTIIFYTLNCIYLVHSDHSTLLLFNQISFAFYMSAAYSVGMAFSLGFGMIYTRVPWVRFAILVGAGGVVFVACLVRIVDSKVARYVTAGIFIVTFLIQIVVIYHTISVLKYKISNHLNQAYIVILEKQLTKLTRTFYLFIVFFTLSTVGEILNAISVHGTAAMAFWMVFVVSAAVVNGWVLYLIRPRWSLTDPEVMENSM